MNREAYLSLVRQRARAAEEEDLQVAIVDHLNWRLMPGVMFFHVPNQGKRSKRTGQRLKDMGLRPGVHDLIFLLPGPAVFTLELKAGRNGLTSEQEQFGREVEAIGGSWAVASSLDDALRILEAVGAIKEEVT